VIKMLLVPIPTTRFLSKCSTYYAVKQQGLAFLRGGEDRFVYCAVPKEGNANFVNDAGLVDHPRWKNVEVGYLTGDRFQNMLFPPEDFGQFTNWGQIWDWDVLVTTSNNGWFWRMFTQARPAVDKKFPRLLLLIDAFPMLTFKKTVTWNEQRDIAFLASYVAFDQVTVQSEHERRGMLAAARRCLSPSMVAEIMNKLTVTYPLPSVDLTKAEQRVSSDAGPLRLVYTQRLDLFERRRDEMLDVLRGAFRLSKDVEVVITTNSNVRSVSGNDSGFLAFKQSDRTAFYELLSSCDVSLTWSREEGIPYSLLEAAAHGVIPIAKREPWSIEFYGATYWGLVNTEAEAVAKIRWINAHRAECRRNFAKWYRDEFCPHVLSAADLDQRQEAWIQAHWATLRGRIADTGESLAAMIDRAPIDTVDLNDDAALGKLPGVRLKEDKAPMQPPLSRRRDVYVDRLRLLMLHGWSDSREPGVLLRDGANHVDSRSEADAGRVYGEVEAGQEVEPGLRGAELAAVAGEEVQPAGPGGPGGRGGAPRAGAFEEPNP